MVESSDSVHSRRRDLLRGAAIFFVLMNVNMRLRLGHVPYGQPLPLVPGDTAPPRRAAND
jgi:hypothetical protein